MLDFTNKKLITLETFLINKNDYQTKIKKV